MRRRRMWIVLVLALVSGLAAAYLALNYLRQPTSPIRAATPSTTEVVVAARDLPLGAVLGPEDVKLVQWPSEALPEGYSASTDEVLNRGVIAPLRLNEPLLPGKLAVKEEGGGLPIVIPAGMRAVSVKVDEVINVAGFVLPSTRVDVLVTLSREAQQQNPITKLILQNVPVLSSGQIIERDEEGRPQNVTVSTLLVTPEEAEKLVLAATEGRIQLALRNPLDLDTVQTEGIRVTGLVPGQRVVRPTAVRRRVPRPVPRSTARTIEVYRGPKLETTTVEGEGGSQ
ncbi:MAG: Flp pilus assembly protein CpaB [Gemmatimonadota bacterium]